MKKTILFLLLSVPIHAQELHLRYTKAQVIEALRGAVKTDSLSKDTNRAFVFLHARCGEESGMLTTVFDKKGSLEQTVWEAGDNSNPGATYVSICSYLGGHYGKPVLNIPEQQDGYESAAFRDKHDRVLLQKTADDEITVMRISEATFKGMIPAKR